MMDAEALVCVVDDDAPMRESLQNLLRSVGLRVEAFASAQEFLRSPRPEGPSCLVLDVQLPGLSGLELQQQLAEGDMAMPIIFITGHGDIPMTVQAMKAGAVEFLSKPFGCKSPHKHLGVKQLPEGWSLDELVYPLPQATPLSVRHPLGRFGSRPVDRLAFEPASVGTPRQRNAPNPR